MWVKYKTITNNTLFDDSLPLDDEMELEDGVSSNEEMNILFFPYRKSMRFYKFIYFVKK